MTLPDELHPEVFTSSEPPDKPMPPADGRVIAETCSCGSSISIPVHATGSKALLSDWRSGHVHQTGSTAPLSEAETVRPETAPAVGTFHASSRPFGFSG
jgi:hypothetical protein